MIETLFLSNAVLLLAAAILFYAAVTDLKYFIIRNELIAILGFLFFAHIALTGRWKNIPENIGLALVIFMFLLLFYLRRWVGGGDVKLLTVAFLWAGLENAFVFSILLCIFAALHTLVVKLGSAGAAQVGQRDGRTRIAFAPSIAAALIGVWMLNASMR